MTNSGGHFFVIGETYKDRARSYKVISLEGKQVVFEYADGTLGSGDIEIRARIHQNILAERNLKQTRQAPMASRRRNPHSNKAVFFSHDEVFPIIAHVIENYSKHSDHYMKHGWIVEALIKDPEANLILDRLPKDKSASWWAGDMVAFFSKVFTEGRSDWSSRFERDDIDGNWGYRARQP